MHLLFVCTGNICRSPLAERLTTAFAAEAGLGGRLTAESAGVGALVGRPMDPDAALVLTGLGGSATGFTARAVNADIVRSADLVVTMERDQIAKVLAAAPRAMRRATTLGELSAAVAARPDGPLLPDEVPGLVQERRARTGRVLDEDIRDPYRRGLTVHAEVGEAIAAALLPVLHRLTPGMRDQST